MKKPIFLILIGIGVLLLVVGVVFVVPWFGKILGEMEQVAERHGQHKHALRMTANQPLTEEQQHLLSQLLDRPAAQDPDALETLLSTPPYLTYINAREGEGYTDFQAYVEAMPTENMSTIARARVSTILGTDNGDTELDVWTNYYFIVRAWGTTVENPLDNINALNELQQTHLIGPLMANDAEVSDFHTKIVQIGMSSMFITEDNTVFKEAWRERLETHGQHEGLLRCAIATPDEFALMRSFFADMAAFQEWILARPDPEAEEAQEAEE